MNPDSSPAYNTPTPVAPQSGIVPGPNGPVLPLGAFRSPNYNPGQSGWKIDANGDVEFNNGVFRGDVQLGGVIRTISRVEDLQTSINEVSADGGGTIYLAPGTYYPTADITLPSNVYLRGAVRDECIIDFASQAFQITSVGSDAYTTGTVSVNDGSGSVTGSGTTWTAAMVGRTIFLNDSYYTISARSSNTAITITPTYSGTNLSGAYYTIATPTINVLISDLTVQNSTLAGIKIQYSLSDTIYNVNSYNNGTGLDIDDTVGISYQLMEASGNAVNLDFKRCYSWTVDNTFFNNATGNGIVMLDSGNATFFNNGIDNSTGDGMNLTNVTNVAFISVTASRSGGQGVELVAGCNDNQFISFTADGNTSDGFKLTATSDRNVFNSCPVKNNGGWGINIAAASCDDNILIGVTMDGTNTSGSITDSGTGTLKSTTVNKLP